MKHKDKAQTGITLVELVTVVAIIGILSAIAMPLYTGYIRQAQLNGAIAGSTLWKTAVEQCILDNGGTKDCDGGIGLIPSNIATGDAGQTIEYIDSLTTVGTETKVTITVTTTVVKNGNNLTQIYESDSSKGYITWTESGTGF